MEMRGSPGGFGENGAAEAGFSAADAEQTLDAYGAEEFEGGDGQGDRGDRKPTKVCFKDGRCTIRRGGEREQKPPAANADGGFATGARGRRWGNQRFL